MTRDGSAFDITVGPHVVRRAVRVSDPSALGAAIDALGVPRAQPVMVLIGGAGNLAANDSAVADAVIANALLPVAIERGAALVDGGTDSGIMRCAGQARVRLAAQIPLVGTAAIGTVSFAGNAAARSDAARLQPDHTHFVLVPGTDWGAESPWLPRVAHAIAAGRPVVTVLINGGAVSAEDVRRNLEANFPVVVVRGTGRLADQLASADAAATEHQDIVKHPRLHVTRDTGPESLRALLTRLLQDC